MHGYQVDVDELRHNGNVVTELGNELAACLSLKYWMAAGEVGHEELARALAEFQRCSRVAIGVLCGVTGEAGTRLSETAATYLDGDRATADTIAGRTRYQGDRK